MSAARTLTIAEASELTGSTVKALRNRCDRGQLRFVVRGGVRRIPLSELHRAGLLEGAAEELPVPEDAGEARELVSRELLAELGRAQEELGKLRAIAELSESTLREQLDAERADRELAERRADELAAELAAVQSRGLVARLRNR